MELRRQGNWCPDTMLKQRWGDLERPAIGDDDRCQPVGPEGKLYRATEAICGFRTAQERRTMSRQIAVLLDNSGSMFQPVGGGNANPKIYEAARGAEFLLENMIDRLCACAGSRFAISVHHFATYYELLPGGDQVDSTDPGFAGALIGLKASIPAIEAQAEVQKVLGSGTDLYDAVRKTADFMVSPANQPGLGEPTSRIIFLFSDGIPTVPHNGALTMAGYEAEQGARFAELLNARGIKLVAWGVGSDALGVALEELKNQAVAGGTNPVSDSKVLFPIDATGTFPNCTTIVMNNAFDLVDNDGILPLRPAGQPGSCLPWEQFSLPAWKPALRGPTLAAVPPSQLVNSRDFEVDVDGSSKELILGMVAHSRRARPFLQATSPSGNTFTSWSKGTRTVEAETASALKIPNPEEGTWRVRVNVDAHSTPSVIDLMARTACAEVSLQVEASPPALPSPGKVRVTVWPRMGGKTAEGRLTAAVELPGGQTTALARQHDGSFTGTVKVSHPGVSILRARVEGELPLGKTIRRFRFVSVAVGRAADPRFTVSPSTYRQGQDYTVRLNMLDGRFTRRTEVAFGAGISVRRFQVFNDTMAQAEIRVSPDAFVGEREAVTFQPEAESLGVVRVIQGERGPGPRGRIRCLKFDVAGSLAGVVLDDGKEVNIHVHDERIQKLLERARELKLGVDIGVDGKGCLVSITICR